MSVYKITYSLNSPVIISEPLHFDALLTAVHPKARPVYDVNHDLLNGEIPSLKLPVQKVVAPSGDWVWGASTINLEDATPYQSKHTKRKGGVDMFGYISNIMTIGGMYKDNFVEDRGYIAPRVSFLAASENASALLEMAKKVGNIGKLRGMGYGEVKSVQIETYEGDWRDILVKSGRAVRNLPQAFLENLVESVVNILPPYWGIERRKIGAKPGDPITLRRDLKLC